MKKKKWIMFTALLFLLYMIAAAYSQEDMRFIDNKMFKKPVRPPAAFPHDSHNENANIEECNVCHHVYKNGVLLEDESSEDQSCSDCHQEKPSADNVLPLRKAFHSKCIKCHKKRKAGPVMCGECHRKK